MDGWSSTYPVVKSPINLPTATSIELALVFRCGATPGQRSLKVGWGKETLRMLAWLRQHPSADLQTANA
jgi:hypothetical protein